MTFTLKELGWKQSLQEAFETIGGTGHTVARVAVEHKGIYRIFSEHGELLARLSGKMMSRVEAGEERPAVGDWVVIAARPKEGQATVHHMLPRFSKFSRQNAGTTTTEQIVASNIDTVFLVTALNRDFNLRRIERYLLTAWESGARPVIVLSKADLSPDVEGHIREVEGVALGVPIHAVSAQDNDGLAALGPYLIEGETTAFLGSSGVGKSTLINRLFGREVLSTGDIREDDDRGRHTTTHRELLVLPEGGIVIDTPGMRELQLWGASEGLSHSFEDIEHLAENCKFRDCTHKSEPGCAVQHAIAEGDLDQERYQSYKKLLKELAYLERKTDQKAKRVEKEKYKQLSKQMRNH